MAKVKTFEPRSPAEIKERLADMVDHQVYLAFFEPLCGAWKEWVEYKFLQHKQAFATVGSECAAIKKLHYLAEGEPFLAARLIEYAMGELWEGFYMPKEPGLWAHWKKQAAGIEAPKFEQPPIDPGLKMLVEQEGWPEAAFRSPSWFDEESAEAVGSYLRYLTETRTFFGDLTPENHLTPSEWERYVENGGITPKTLDALLSRGNIAARRLRFHIDFHKSGYSDIRTFLGIK